MLYGMTLLLQEIKEILTHFMRREAHMTSNSIEAVNLHHDNQAARNPKDDAEAKGPIDPDGSKLIHFVSLRQSKQGISSNTPTKHCIGRVVSETLKKFFLYWFGIRELWPFSSEKWWLQIHKLLYGEPFAFACICVS